MSNSCNSCLFARRGDKCQRYPLPVAVVIAIKVAARTHLPLSNLIKVHVYLLCIYIFLRNVCILMPFSLFDFPRKIMRPSVTFFFFKLFHLSSTIVYLKNLCLFSFKQSKIFKKELYLLSICCFAERFRFRKSSLLNIFQHYIM